MIKKLWNELLDCVYPPSLYCVCCRKIIDDSRTYRLCSECMDGMKWALARCCNKCGKPLSDNNPNESCFSCREHAHSFDRGYCCTEYGAHERAMVFAMKYDNRPDIAKSIAEIMSDRLDYLFGEGMAAYRFDLLVPVPVSEKRRGERGYNQAALIAEELGLLMGLRYKGEMLFRSQDTAAMKGLSPAERRANIRGCFGIRPGKARYIEGMRCLVIDDIYTTGATVDEIAKVLKQAGASEVCFLSFASGADVIKS